MTRNRFVMALALALMLAVPGLAQSDQTQTQPAASTSAPPPLPEAQQPVASERQPLELEQKEGFWGRLNPFARKKYVRKQLTPVVGRVNELDELTALNAKNIKDVDSRATEGIRMASLKVSEADQKAVEAGNRANLANETANKATSRIGEIEKAVETVDKYDAVSDLEIRFRPGQNILSRKAKEALDDLAQPLKDQKGYVVEVQGFSSGSGRAALENSQNMAEAVVRYLVIEHEIPVYRVFTAGLGNVPIKAEDGSRPRRIKGGRVNVSLLRNGLAQLQSTASAQPVAGAGDQMALPQSDQPPQKQDQQKKDEEKSDQPK